MTLRKPDEGENMIANVSPKKMSEKQNDRSIDRKKESLYGSKTWQCICGHKNPVSTENCHNCFRSKENQPSWLKK